LNAVFLSWTDAYWRKPEPQPRMLDIAREVAGRYGLGVVELLGHRRQSRLIEARQEFYWLCRKAKKTYPQIGRFCGHHHTSCLYGAREHVKRRGITATAEPVRSGMDAVSIVWPATIIPAGIPGRVEEGHQGKTA